MADYTEIDLARVRRLVNDADQLLRTARDLLEVDDSPHRCVGYAWADLTTSIGKLMDVNADLDLYDSGAEHNPFA